MWMPLTPARCISRAQSSRVCGSAKSSFRSVAMSMQRLLDHPGDHAGIGAAAAHRGDAAGAPAAQIKHAFAQRIVRALRDRTIAVGIETRPRLHHRVDVEGIEILAQLDQIDRRSIDRQIDHHAAPRPAGEQRGEQLAIVLPGHCQVKEADLPLVQQMAVAVIGRDDHEFRAIEGDVPLDQRQRAFADRSETDHHDRAVETGVQRPVFSAGAMAFMSITPVKSYGGRSGCTRRSDCRLATGPGRMGRWVAPAAGRRR